MSSRRLSLILANVLVAIATLVFAVGFFPYKAVLPGLAEYENLDFSDVPTAPFDKVVFMVVDALRSDFVYAKGSGFSFTQSLISSGAAVPFTAHATSPTITMPRIKAITTGSVPSYIDVILNFAESDTTSTLATQDTWLAQMKAKGTGKLAMYGDDTWLKLFPGMFDRMDGTTSFFVADFTEVDNNVTRHIPDELLRDDWNTVVLHYLGLDHIGHKAGPRSPNMVPKQQEMDGVVRQLYEAMATHDYLGSTLLVLCGDHGMNDAGNHGGSSAGETSPALVFIAPQLKKISKGQISPAPFKDEFHYYRKVEQSDIAPTLGALLGFPSPRNNLGKMIEDFLPFWPDGNDKLQIQYRTARQILNIVTATYSESPFASVYRDDCEEIHSEIGRLGCAWVAIEEKLSREKLFSEEDTEHMLAALNKWSSDAQELMSGTASNYDMTKLVTGQILAILAVAAAIWAALPTLAKSPLSTTPFLAVVLLYGIMMFASSYVEEEQHLWYWACSGWLALLIIKALRQARSPASSALALICLRLARRWNQTGQKHAGEPDIAHSFLPQHTHLLWVLIAILYTVNAYQGTYGYSRLQKLGASLLSFDAAFFGISFKAAFTSEDAPELMPRKLQEILDWNPTSLLPGTLLVHAQAVWFMIALCALLTVGAEILFRRLGYFPQGSKAKPTIASRDIERQRFDFSLAVHAILVLVLATESRAANIPLLLIFTLQSQMLLSPFLSQLDLSTSFILLQYASFFALGGSNAISSIDLSSAYNGVGSYNVAAVGLLTLVSNWAGPVFFASVTASALARIHRTSRMKPTGPGSGGVFLEHIALMTLFVTVGTAFVMAACTVLRAHLFIWTVFSPKYLYTIAWTFGGHLLINVGLGGGLFWLYTM